jgi:hypothetical protein
METPERYYGWVEEILNNELAASQNKRLMAVILGLVPVKDGNQWCVLYGENLQVGIAGFGETLYKAMQAFEDKFHKV